VKEEEQEDAVKAEQDAKDAEERMEEKRKDDLKK